MLILKCDTKTSLQSTSLSLINCHFSQPNLTSSSSYTAAAWVPTSRRIGRFLGRGKEVFGKDKSQHLFLFFTGDHEEIQTLFLFFSEAWLKNQSFVGHSGDRVCRTVTPRHTLKIATFTTWRRSAFKFLHFTYSAVRAWHPPLENPYTGKAIWL